MKFNIINTKYYFIYVAYIKDVAYICHNNNKDIQKMETVTKNSINNTKHEVYYNSESNTATYSIGKYVVASLDFKTDEFECDDDLQNDADYYYNAMTNEKTSVLNDDYDVRAEQDLYANQY